MRFFNNKDRFSYAATMKKPYGMINKLSEITNKIEIVDKNVDEIIDFFVRGYPYDEDDPK
ncbi:hypothetical protein COJ46_22835 [Bacillus sp. AFS077874]|nr:hypothetical protein CON00_00100 [Bacillus sp. AFS096315]PFM74835.1 hypothetical protein COJ46_22835 [Bacillus sp. AFS077874]